VSEVLFYSPLQIAELLGVSRRTVYRRMNIGDIPHVRMGGQIRIHRNTLAMLVNPGRSPVPEAIEVPAPRN
jgi:excisionase family DNA binding protein